MMNTALHQTMINGYHAHAYTGNYMLSFTDRHNVYVAYATADVLPYVTCLDKASRGAGYSLRFKPNKAQKELLKMGECFILCSEEYMEAEYKASKYNRGEIVEKLITEHFGQEWHKDSVPFTEDGDLTVDGVAYQIKFQKATFINEKQLMALK